MSVIGDLLSKIRGKRKEKFASKAQEYDSFVAALSRGDEVDVDTLATLLDELDKSDSDLEADIKAKQRRVETAAEIVRLKGVERELRKAEGELQRLRDEVARFVNERKPKIEALAEQTKYQQLDVDRLSTLQDDLLRVGVPFHLQQKKNELQARRMAWGAKQRAYDDEIKRPSDMVRQYRNRLEVLNEQLRRRDSGDHEPLLKSREEVERELAKHQAIIDGLSSDKAALDAELREIEKLEAELNRQLMQP